LSAGLRHVEQSGKRKGMPAEPLRVLVSEDGKIEASARIFHKRISPVIVLTTNRGAKRCAASLCGVATVKPFGERVVNCARAFRWLHEKYGVKRLLCEGGGETNAALIRPVLLMRCTSRFVPSCCEADAHRQSVMARVRNPSWVLHGSNSKQSS
jgi:riboflavin biosynthesis pyrimidine reductase